MKMNSLPAHRKYYMQKHFCLDFLTLFSSPEHEVLLVSYCDRAVSFVRCASSVVNFLPCVRSRGHIFSPILMKLGLNVCLNKISDELEIGSCGVKTRSLGQILEKPCVRSRGHIFSPILMKRSQNVCLDKISDELEIGSCGVRN